jgi:hypothetical protein
MSTQSSSSMASTLVCHLRAACSRAQSRLSQSQNIKLTRDYSLCQWQGPLGQYRRKAADP